MNEVSLERIYGVLKTYKLEQIQQKEIYGQGRVVSMSTALVVKAPEKIEDKVVQPYTTDKEQIIDKHGKTAESQSDAEFYLMEELDQLEDESMAMIVRKFGNFRFRRNPNYKFKSTSNKFQRGGSSSSCSNRGGYKIGMVDRSKIRCFNCNEL